MVQLLWKSLVFYLKMKHETYDLMMTHLDIDAIKMKFHVHT